MVEHHLFVLGPLDWGAWVARVHGEVSLLLQQGPPCYIDLRRLNIFDDSAQNEFLDHISVDSAKSDIVNSERLGVPNPDEVLTRVGRLGQRVNMVDLSCRGHKHNLRILA